MSTSPRKQLRETLERQVLHEGQPRSSHGLLVAVHALIRDPSTSEQVCARALRTPHGQSRWLPLRIAPDGAVFPSPSSLQ